MCMLGNRCVCSICSYIFHPHDSTTPLVSSPDLIRHVYCLQYNARDTESDTRAGIGFGSGTETREGLANIAQPHTLV